ncbi:MAG: OsmC family protein [Candidatus Bathyarchaeota archaeon]|jgi:putative redox protein
MKKIDKSDPSKTNFVKVKWIDGLRFVAIDNAGHSVVMDPAKQSGGEETGFSPMQLLLIALGGCTGMDVLHIMKKQRQQVNGLEIFVAGKRVKEPPQVYDNINVEYKINGTNIEENAIKRAIRLSENKYCSVGAMLRTKAKVTSNYTVHKESCTNQ